MTEIKKVIVPASSLPPTKFPEEGYFVRYRIISEDKNRASHWSLKYFVPRKPFNSIVASLSLNQSSSNPEDWTFTSIWTPNSEDQISSFDIYVNWDSEGWQYVGSSGLGFFSSNVRLGSSSLDFALQIPTFPKERYESATVFSKTVSL